MSDELIDIYDENDVPLGITRLKSEVHRDGLWHHTASVFVFDTAGNVLLQKRSKNMNSNGGKWSPTAGGYVEPGESDRDAAARELQEETGLRVLPEALGDPVFFSSKDTYPDGTIKAQFKYVYFLHTTIDTDRLSLQESEVGEARIFTLDEIDYLLRHHPEDMSAVGDGYWELALSEIRKRLGV